MENKIDVQYAGSRLSGMGEYSASWINGAITQVMNEQQARVGRFLTYKQKLYNLASRSSNIKSADSTRGTSLLGRCSSAQANQVMLESRAIELLSSVSKLQTNPIVKLLTNTNINQDDLSADLIARGAEIISTLRGSILQSASLNSELTKHEEVVIRLEKDINSIEGELAGRGLLAKAGKGLTNVLSAPIQYVKWAAIIVAGGLFMYYGAPLLLKKRK